MRSRNISLYVNGEINQVFNGILNSIKQTIDSEKEDYILNVNEVEYCSFLSKKHLLDIPELHFDSVQADSVEKDIPSSRFPLSYDTYGSKSYKRDVIRYHIPFTGNISLLSKRPSKRFSMSGGQTVSIMENAIVFEYINFDNNVENIRREYSRDLDSIRANYGFVREECKEFNESLMTVTRSYFNQRKRTLLNKNNLLSQLGVPIKESGSVSKTFSVPKVAERSKINPKPKVTSEGFKPEPTIDLSIYTRILQLIDDVCQNFEKYPSTYVDKDEEALRDQILLFLQPNFENASATGETFNKRGKTDILVRYESSNVFIAECKFWSGKKKLLETIDQLLKYSTWRDTKTAIIVFVRNKEISTVLDTVMESTPDHANFFGFVNKQGEHWFNFRFHLNGDRNREIKTAIMLYHIPEVK